MQGLADGDFILPYTIGDYLAELKPGARAPADGAEFMQAADGVATVTKRLLSVRGRQPVCHFHKRLGHILWQHCGMARNREGLGEALQEIPALRGGFWANGLGPRTGAALQPP